MSAPAKDSPNLEAIYPLSPAQQGMLFHTLYAPGTGIYLNQLHYTIHGPLDTAALERAWQRVVDWQPSLRTLFLWKNRREPLQVVRQQARLPWAFHDWRGLSTSEQPSRLERFLAEDRQRGFELDRAPLLRCALMQLGDQAYQFVWTHHHLILDGWSGALLNEAVLSCYCAFTRGQEVRLEPPVPYRDYVAWLQRQERPAAETFWREQLKGFATPTPLVVDWPIEPTADPRAFAEQSALLDSSRTSGLKERCRELRVTLSSVIQGAWAILLIHYSGEEEVLFGATVSGRSISLPGADRLVGLMINTVPVRVRFSPRMALGDWLRRLVVEQGRREEHAWMPLADIQRSSEVPKGLALFESVLVFENFPAAPEAPAATSLEFGTLRAIERTNYPLTIIVEPGRELSLQITYDSQRFDAETVRRLLGHLQTVLDAISAQPHRTLEELPWITRNEQAQLLEEWNRTKGVSRSHCCLHESFEAQVDKTPDAIALSLPKVADAGAGEIRELTYRELDYRANQLAAFLRRRGVGPDQLVGLCFDRSIEMVVAILGVLKAGAAYLPLDPAYPEKRLQFMLEDSGAGLVLTQGSRGRELKLAAVEETGDSERHFFPGTKAVLIALDSEWPLIAQQPGDKLDHRSDPDHLAYVIYTSGSTGQPKGVLVTHRNVSRLFTSTDEWFGFGPGDVWTLFHSYGFDFSVWEIWGALLYGGRLVIVPYLTGRSAEAFYRLLASEGVTVLNQTPSAFRQLVQAEESFETLQALALRLVIFGGEALELQSLKPWVEKHGAASPRLINMYGITETTVHVTFRPIESADLESPASVIGCPIPDLQLYILNRFQQLLPAGVPGEIYVGGAGLARGYLNRPDLTAQRFVPHPFSREPGDRLYRTGDLARYLANGDIEYLGRIDDQVKIRGHRVELGEIEAVLAQHSSIRESVVVARDDGNEPSAGRARDLQLVAYLVTRGERPNISDLRRFLEKQLPQYMVPASFVFLEALPRTGNGKLDRRALPEPGRSRPELAMPFVGPRTPEEELLAQIWAEVLGHEKVGVQDNFFELGGDSIRSIWILARARQAGLDFSLKQLFEFQTIAELARVAQQAAVRSGPFPSHEPFGLISAEDCARLPADVEDAYPLTALQTGMLFHTALRPESALYHNVSSFHLKAPFAEEKFREALDLLTQRHAVLRTSFDLSGYREPLQLVHRRALVPLAVTDLRALPPAKADEAIDRWFAAEKGRFFDCARPPLLRFQAHLRSASAFQLTLTEHHAILDGWSVASLITELFQTYCALLRGDTPAPARSSEIAFRDFVAVEKRSLASAEDRAFWRERLDPAPSTRIPRWPAPVRTASPDELAMVDIPVSAEVSAGLKRLARAAAVPVKTVLLAAHLRVLAAVAGEADVVTGLVSNGRLEEEGGDRVLGLFLNTLPFRMRLPDGTWLDLVKEVFRLERESLPFRRHPLAEIQRAAGGRPLFETSFNFTYFHVYQAMLGLDGIEVLGGKFFEKTNFVLDADFSLDLMSSQIQLVLSYDAAEIGREQAGAIGGCYQRALEDMAAHPENRYLSHSLLSEAEEANLRHWNASSRPVPEIILPELVRQQAGETPETVAVLFNETAVTYRELMERAGRLAGDLQSLGAGPEIPVGVCLERSADMIVAMLAVFQAGAVYVPLSGDYPPARLGFMVEDAGLSIVVTEESLAGKFQSAPPGLRCLQIGRDTPAAEAGGAHRPVSGAGLDQAAYLIYTSGSTGNPKGVAVTHRSLVNHGLAMKAHYQLGPRDRVLQLASLSFDASLEQILPTLAAGGVVVPRDDRVWSAAEITETISRLKITVVEFSPAYLLEWLRYLDARPPQYFPELRLVILGGDVVPPEIPALWKRSTLRETRLVNTYGPTEGTITTTLFEMNGLANGGARPVPLGRPIANTQVHILDRQGQPAPIGSPGELCIAGLGLARGYWRRPELTAEKFVANPISASPGSRLYRTGDQARWLPDGTLEFLGRLDDQVKIRGFRIELGEIEAALASHPAVENAVVVARAEREGLEKNLVAYVTGGNGASDFSQELREWCRGRLPPYMLPAAILRLERLPLTSNGKVDRQALPGRLPGRTELDSSFVPPETAMERMIASAWEETMQLERVGAHDNFFDLGGHSLLLVRLHSRLQLLLGREVRLVDLFQYPTVSEQARFFDNPAGQKDLLPSVEARAHRQKEAFQRQRRERVSKPYGDGKNHSA